MKWSPIFVVTALLALTACPGGGGGLTGGWFTEVNGTAGYMEFHTGGTLSWGQSEMDLSGDGTWALDGDQLTLEVGDYTYTGTYSGGDAFSVTGLFDVYIDGVYQGYADYGIWHFTRDKVLVTGEKITGELQANPGMGVAE